jgi:hypothetical protein
LGPNNIWADTARRVAIYQRNYWQHLAARYPALFVLAWFLKIALVDGPIAIVRWVAPLFKGRKRTGDLVQVRTERI